MKQKIQSHYSYEFRFTGSFDTLDQSEISLVIALIDACPPEAMTFIESANTGVFFVNPQRNGSLSKFAVHPDNRFLQDFSAIAPVSVFLVDSKSHHPVERFAFHFNRIGIPSQSFSDHDQADRFALCIYNSML